jgi:hypothetical protein
VADLLVELHTDKLPSESMEQDKKVVKSRWRRPPLEEVERVRSYTEQELG